MARSMTGYGAGKASGTRIAVEAEIRSVNARSFKLGLRTPAALGPREPELDALVRRRVRRGTVTLSVRLTYLRPDDVVRVRPEVVEGLARDLEKLREAGLVEGALTVEALAAIPGALEAGATEPLRPADVKVVREAVEAALDELDAMRERESVHLVRDLAKIAKGLARTLDTIHRRAPDVVAEYRDRLRQRLAVLLEDTGAALDETTLAREVAVYAERCDIAEEVTRLRAHLDEFRAYLESDGEIGRTLDFLTQEMLREANTIGAKSQDVAIARDVITLKSGIDRLKEQVANLE